MSAHLDRFATARNDVKGTLKVKSFLLLFFKKEDLASS